MSKKFVSQLKKNSKIVCYNSIRRVDLKLSNDHSKCMLLHRDLLLTINSITIGITKKKT